jgi:hydrogenase-4 membrane subunit HyfE
MNSKIVPYNTGKVLIGSLYKQVQRPLHLSPEELLLQSALLANAAWEKTFLINLKDNNVRYFGQNKQHT